MSPKAVMTIGVCLLGAYIAFAAWVANTGVVKATLILMFIQYHFGIDSRAFDYVSYVPIVGIGCIVAGWVMKKTR